MTETKVNPTTRVEQVGRSGIFPASGPMPPGDAVVRGQGALAHPEERGSSQQDVWRALGGALFRGYMLYRGIRLLTRAKPGVATSLATLFLVGVPLMRALADLADEGQHGRELVVFHPSTR